MKTAAEIRNHWLLVALAAIVVGLGLASAHLMEHAGHAITGMNNQVVWGLPHVFAIFMIVAASGVLNVASVGSVFGVAPYKARARLAGLLCLALLAGGLMVLMLDLGRPERVIVAATHYNPTSVFAWNVLLYSGMAAIVALYLFTMFERRAAAGSTPAGVAALVWRFVLTTGTGAIFAFLPGRPAYGSALLPLMFIVLSLGWGLAVFVLVQAGLYAARGGAVPPAVGRRLARLLAVFVAAGLFVVAVLHLTNLYDARQQAFEAFVLLGRDGGGHVSLLFWAGFVLVGSMVPFALLVWPGDDAGVAVLATVAAGCVIVGAFAFLGVFIVGGQAFPLELFPGYAASSTFGDGQVASYAPSVVELGLGLGGVGLAALITAVGVHVLDFMPHDEAPAALAAPAGTRP